MILRFRDHQDDVVALDHRLIGGVTLGRLNAPRVMHPNDDRDPHVVTVIHTLIGPFIVNEPAGFAIEVWQQALHSMEAMKEPALVAYPGLVGWEQRADLYDPQTKVVTP